MAAFKVIVSGFTGDYSYLNTVYKNLYPTSNLGYQNQDTDDEQTLYVYPTEERWEIGDYNGNIFAISSESDAGLSDATEVQIWVLQEEVTGNNISVLAYNTECISLSAFYLSGAVNDILQNVSVDNLPWNITSWDEVEFGNANINENTYYQVWVKTWYPNGSNEIANYLFLVGPSVSGDSIFEIYNSTYTTNYQISGSGPILVSNALAVSGQACPDVVIWPGESNILFTFALPALEPEFINPGFTFEQVAATHGGITNFLRLRHLGYF